jgi:hypothetical protein
MPAPCIQLLPQQHLSRCRHISRRADTVGELATQTSEPLSRILATPARWIILGLAAVWALILGTDVSGRWRRVK